MVFAPASTLDARNDSRIGDDFHKGSAIFLLLADCLVVEDHATNATHRGRAWSHQFPPGAPGLFGPGEFFKPGKSRLLQVGLLSSIAQ